MLIINLQIKQGRLSKKTISIIQKIRFNHLRMLISSPLHPMEEELAASPA